MTSINVFYNLVLIYLLNWTGVEALCYEYEIMSTESVKLFYLKRAENCTFLSYCTLVNL